MKKQGELPLMKPRSYRSVLKAGFLLYTENFRRLFKASWIMALLYALCCGALGTLSAIKIPELIVAVIEQVTNYQGIIIEPLLPYCYNMLTIVGLSLLALVILALASATLLNKLKEHKDTGAIIPPASWLKVSPRLMLRTLKGAFLTLLIIVLPLLLIAGAIMMVGANNLQQLQSHTITITATYMIVTVIIIILALPMTYTLMKYIMEAPCGYFSTLSRHYGKGMKHWGGLFLVYFVSALVVALTELVVMMPAQILNIANQSAHLGLLKGDPLGMPSYITTLTFATFVFCCFIQFYVSQILLVHNYYLYGTIEAKEEEQSKIEHQ